jgi:RNA 2',3'-cyclic 3'-phosphodiesterase
MRLFTAITLPQDVRQHLVRVQEYLAGPVWELPGVKWTAPDNLHLTLKFLGEVDDDKLGTLTEALAAVRVQPMALFAERIGAFPKRGRAHVITVNPGGDAPQVAALFDQIDHACQVIGAPRDRRAFTPHVTIGRSRSGVDVRRIELRDPDLFPGPIFVASQFQLLKSTLTPDGSIYEVVEKYG